MGDKGEIPVYGYIRKSTEDNQEGESRRQQNSLEYQMDVINEVAKKNNLRIVKVFRDSKSGYKAFLREGFEEMLDTIREAGKESSIKGIVCSEHNRLARNFGDGGLILWYLQDGYINRIYTHDKIFTDSSSDQMMLAINFAMAKLSSDETSFRSKRTNRSIAKRGQPPSRHIPGYKYVGKDGKRYWIINKSQAEIVKNMFQKFSTGKYTVADIYDYATSNGLRSAKTGKPYKAEKSIRDLLKRKEYTGVFDFDGEERSGEYKALISSELFYRVQEVLEGTAHNKSEGKNEYAYTGLVKCSVCHGNMSGTIRKGITYYRCLNRAEPCKSNKESRPSYLKEALIDSVIEDSLKDVNISEKTFKKLSSYVSEIFDDEKASYRYEIAQLKGKLSRAQDDFDYYTKEIVELKRMSEGLRDKEWKTDMEGLKRLRESAKQEMDSYKRMIKKAENMKEEIPSLMMNFLENIKLVSSRFKSASPSNKRQIVETLCANFQWDGEKLSWDWKEPYHMITNSKEKGTWLRE